MVPEQAALFVQKFDLGSSIQADPVAALTLFDVSGVGSARYRALLKAFGSPDAALKASDHALREIPGIDVVTASAIRQADQERFGEKLWRMLNAQQARLVSIWDLDYPTILQEIHDPPALLFVRGELPSAELPCLAIVGTRNPTLYGIKQAHQIASELAAAGFGVVSGLARGIDTAAHEGALQGKGKTYAIFGCGIDVIYPEENKSMALKIVESGGLISEFLPGTKPDGGLFPRRNRIISGLSRGVLVVQGSETSGAMITARCALEQNREVFALPGSVEDRRSRGPHELIRQGATLVESAQCLFRELGSKVSPESLKAHRPQLPALNPSEQVVLTKLSSVPIHIDTLVRELELPVSSVLADLLGLEMKGWVAQLPGKLFVLQQV